MKFRYELLNFQWLSYSGLLAQLHPELRLRLTGIFNTFCIHSLKQFLANGIDHRVAPPILSVYMGHSSIAATGKYLRLTAEAYPEISNMMETKFGELIPEWRASEDETD